MRYDGKSIGAVAVDGHTSTEIIKRAGRIVNQVRTFKFECKICMILYKDKARDPAGALRQAEKSFAVTKLDPAHAVFGPIWEKCLELKASAPAP